MLNVKDYGATGDGTTNDRSALLSAISAAGPNGSLMFPPGTYLINERLTPLNGQTWCGSGKGVTVIKGAGTSDYALYNNTSLSNFMIQSMTFDVNNVTNGSAVQLYYANACVIDNVEFKNVPVGGWMLKLGVSDGLNDTTLCRDNLIIDCDFDTHAGSLEMLLLFNCKNTRVIRPTFKNKTTPGPTFGLWQKCYDTKIVDPHFRDCRGPNFYYSVTVEDTWLLNPYFENCGQAIQGANSSDNGNFGETKAKNLYIINPRIKGSTNSTTAVAIQLGAVDGVLVSGPNIDKYQIGIHFNGGNEGNNALTTNWSVVTDTIRNCNPENNYHAIHPAILFSGIGGSMYGRLSGSNIFDDQPTKTQRYPIAFEGGFMWDDLVIQHNRLSPDTANGGVQVKLNGSSTLGSRVVISDN